MKKLVWLGDSKKSMQAFPVQARRQFGFELFNVQLGNQPGDSKPIPNVGRGVEEIRVWVESGTYRAMHIARLAEAVYVLHAFQKKTQQTSKQDIELARTRLEKLLRLKM